MLRTFIYRFTYRLYKESVGAYAAQITFYMIMSLVPLITLVGMMLTRTNLITADGVIALIQNYHSIPEAAMDVIVSVFDNLDRGTTGSYVLYVIIILYAASRSVRGSGPVPVRMQEQESRCRSRRQRRACLRGC